MEFDDPSRIDIIKDRLLHHGLVSSLYGRYADSLGLEGDEKVLDFGSGSGALSRHIARRLLSGGGRLTCLDTSEAWTHVATQRLKQFPNVDFTVGDITRLDSDPDGFDVIVVHLVLHEVEPEKRQKTIDALSRNLKSTGTLFIREPTKESHGTPAAEIRQLMHNAGLTESEFTESRSLLLPPMYAGVFRKASPA